MTKVLKSRPAEQFSERKNLTDSEIKKIEKDINKKFTRHQKRDEISEALYTKLRSTMGQPAKRHGLAKKHEQGTPLPPVFSSAGSSYDHLNET